MHRNFFISIHDPCCDGQHSKDWRDAGQGQSPGPGFAGSATHDPKKNLLMPPPDDPKKNLLMPPPDDPRFRQAWSANGGSPCTCGTSAGVQTWGCAAGSTPEGSVETDSTGTDSTRAQRSGFVIVRLGTGVDSYQSESLWALATEDPKRPGLKAILELPFEEDLVGARRAEQPVGSPEPPGVLVSRPLVDVWRRGDRAGALSRGDTVAAIHKLEEMATGSEYSPLASLADFWRIDTREVPERIDEIVEAFKRLSYVEVVYPELLATDPSASALPATGVAYAEDQGYLDSAPTGIGARWAWNRLGSNPKKVRIVDLEQAWYEKHEELQGVLNGNADPLYGANRAKEGGAGAHGTAVLGQLAAAGTAPYALAGAAAKIAAFRLASHYKSAQDQDETEPFRGTNGHIAAAIINTLLALANVAPAQLAKPYAGAGDFLLIEVERGGLPVELADEADFHATRLASALGLIVVAAAGNGSFDFDSWVHPVTGATLNRSDPGFRDSGAVLVGASYASVPHHRAPYSNYGSRIDCYGWGERVTTCGYGDLAGTTDEDHYTNQFSGTSSAAPIIVGAAALLQSLHATNAGYRLPPRAMRSLLSDPTTGTPQGGWIPGHIGVMPNLQAIVEERLALVPAVYLRRSIDDDGSPPDWDETISSSPDIFVKPRGLAPQKVPQRFGEGSETMNQPAPGAVARADKQDRLHVRLRNRGLRAGEVDVHLFAAPAATLITPERWLPAGNLQVAQISQGDTLTVSTDHLWDEPLAPPAMPWSNAPPAPTSFLAVLEPAEDKLASVPHLAAPSVLPPGGRDLDWESYLAFLRRPGIGWRNVHRLEAGSDVSFSFFFAGTPEQTRHFDFEVIQRLPKEARLTLRTQPAFAAKLHQGQGWLGSGSGVLELPERPRTTFEQVELPMGACVPAVLRVRSANLAAGHSLAVRQLWRQQEVGRLTIVFSPRPSQVIDPTKLPDRNDSVQRRPASQLLAP